MSVPAPPAVAEAVESTRYAAGPVPEVTVVVATHDRAPFLAGLFTALEDQTYPPGRFEVVVIDDASPGDSWAELVAHTAATPLRCRALRLSANVGQGTGRNVGIDVARGEVVVFTDDDCLPTPGWLEALTSPLRHHRGPVPGAVVAQGATHAWPGDAGDGGPWARTVWVQRPTWLFETCNVAYRRRDLRAVGGFPARGDAPVAPTGRLVGEDALLGWRVLEHGARLEFVAEAVVHHRHLPSRYVDWLGEQRGKAAFPALLTRSPFGARVLWRRWFLAPRTAAFDLAVLGMVAAVVGRRGRWLAAAAPWVWLALPDAASRPGRHPAVRLAQLALGDAVSLGVLAAASIRHRKVVL